MTPVWLLGLVTADATTPFLLPPDLRDWRPDGHLAWCVLDVVVDQLDLGPLLRAYRADGMAIPPTTPSCYSACCCMGYCLGVRSSRRERRLDASVGKLDRLVQRLADATAPPQGNAADQFTVEAPHRPIADSGP
jgi:hypothetical protein